MCIAVAARILELDGASHRARAEVSGNIITVNTRLVPAKVGDYVLVHAGCAIEIVTRDAADELSALYRELGLWGTGHDA